MSITTIPYGFIPTQVSGLVLWLDASDPTTITQSSGNISQWRDKSSSALTATGVSNPTLVANIQNGFPGISFDGSTQYFNLGNNLNMGTNQLYIFVVSKFNSTADGGIIGKSLYGSQGGRYSLLRNGAMIPLIEASGGAVNNSGLNSDTSTAARLLNMVWDRSNIYLYQNGTSVFSAGLSDTSNLTNGNSLLIGAYQNSSGGTPPVAGFYMNGYIHEILMYMTPTGSPLGNTVRQQIESYLAQKWGLTLSAGHPGLTSTVYRSTYLKNSAVKRNIATMVPFFTAFSPRQIPGCALWLDGADSSTILFSSGSNVSTWSDKSGNGRNATVYAGTPTYTSALGMTFNGSSSLQITYTASPILESMFVIIKFNSVSGQGDILSGTAAGQREYLMYVPYSPGTIYLGRHSTGPSGAINGGTVTTGSNYLLGYVFNGTGNTISFFQSGNIITSGTPQFTYSAGGTISVIGSYNGGGYLQGQIYEMIIYSTALSITERQQIESYLSQKWGLTASLPAGHLHATQPAGARTALSLTNTKMKIITRLYSPIVTTIGNFTSIVGGAAGGGLWMTAVTPNGDIYTKSYNPTVYRLRDTTYSNPFSCDNWGQGLTTDGTFVYGTDTNSAQIFRFNPANSTRNLLLNNITSPCGLAADGIGNIYISQQIWQNPNNTLIRYNISANTSTTLYNVSLSTYYFAGMAPDGLGNLYLSDYVTNKIYKLNSSNVLSTVAGSGTAGFADGIGAAASFNISMYINFSNNLCYDGNGNLYLAETNNNRIRKIVIATGLVTTIAGTGVSGTVNGPGLSATLTSPLGISYANGYLYWCEDKIVRRLTL